MPACFLSHPAAFLSFTHFCLSFSPTLNKGGAVEIPAKLLIANASSAGDSAAPTIDVAEQMNQMQNEMAAMKVENDALKSRLAELERGGASGNPVTDTVVRLSCEALGAAPSGFKCPTKVHPDSMVIIDVDGLRALKFTSTIQGPLTIHNIAAGFDLTEYVQNLQHVAGDITVDNNAGLKTANFSALVRVDGGITFTNNDDATLLELPLLDITNTTARKDNSITLAVHDNLKLESVVVKDFTHLYGQVSISSNAELKSFELAALEVLAAPAGMVSLQDNGKLHSVSLPALVALEKGRSLSVTGNAALTSFNVLGLETMETGSKVAVGRNGVLASLAFPALTRAAVLDVRSNPTLNSVDVSQVAEAESIHFDGNSNLAIFSLPQLKATAAFTFTGTPAKSTVSLPLLKTLTETLSITIEGGRVDLSVLDNALSEGLVGKVKLFGSGEKADGNIHISWPVEVQNLFASNPDFETAFGPNVVKWVVQQDAVYRIRAAGAAGTRVEWNYGGKEIAPAAAGGRGAVIVVSHSLKKGDVLDLVPGRMSATIPYFGQGTYVAGGGGTFVSFDSRDTLLVAAGGGAAPQCRTQTGSRYLIAGKDAELGKTGGTGTYAEGGTDSWNQMNCGLSGTPWDDSMHPRPGIDGSDASSCYPACLSRDCPSYPQLRHICADCKSPGRGYDSFKLCGHCAAAPVCAGDQCGSGGRTAECLCGGSGYSGGASPPETNPGNSPTQASGGGGSYYQHPESTVISTSIENTGPGSIFIDAL